MDENHFDLNPVVRHPITGDWWKTDDIILDLNFRSIISIKSEYIEIPDEWVLPVTRRDLPPKPNQKINIYILSEEGLNANRDRLSKGFKYKKCTFEEFCDCIISNSRRYFRTLNRRKKREELSNV